MKWLFVTSEPPWPLAHGTWLRVYHLARALVEGQDSVSVLSYEDDGTARARYAEIGATLLPGPTGSPLLRGKARCWGAPYAYDKTFAAHVGRYARQFDAVVLVRPRMLQYAREAGGAGCVLADLVDDPILEERRAPRGTWRPWNGARFWRFILGEYLYERKFLPGVSAGIFVSSEEAGNFRRRHKTPAAAVVPNGVDAGFFVRPPSYDTELDRPIVTFLGNMRHPPNEEAAVFLVHEIAPLIWHQIPRAQVLIAGSNPSRRVRDLAGARVQVTGYVEDVRPLLWETRACLLPMRTGTGIKNKLLESWAAGAPVVTTPLACRGVPAKDGENVLLGRSPAELADRTVRLLKDLPLCRTLANNGRQTVRDHLTWSIAANRLQELVVSPCRAAGVDRQAACE